MQWSGCLMVFAGLLGDIMRKLSSKKPAPVAAPVAAPPPAPAEQAPAAPATPAPQA